MKNLVLILGLLVATRVALADEPVTVHKNPGTVMVRIFDPKYPPKEMPKLNKDEAAVTESGFSCQVQVEVETQSGGDEAAKTKIVSVVATLKLDVTVWLPRNPPAKVRAHEDGHRAISELYYQNVEGTAKEIAKRYIGKE